MGYANNEQIDRPLFIHNTSFSYQRKGSGVRAFFLQQPVLKDSTIKVLLRMNQTLLLGPLSVFDSGSKSGSIFVIVYLKPDLIARLRLLLA